MLDFLINWLFPHFCVLCRQETDEKRDLCGICATLLPWAKERCFRCGLRLQDFNHISNCQRCVESPLTFDRLCTLFDYVTPARDLVTGLKFSKKLNYGRLCGELLAEKILTEWYKDFPLPDAFLPVPLHIKRLRKRGYNQALELLWPIHKQTKIPILIDYCERLKATKPQSALLAHLRKFNVHEAFRVTKPIPYEHIAIIDDVVTTASTVNSLSLTLKESGVMKVDVLCICR